MRVVGQAATKLDDGEEYEGGWARGRASGEGHATKEGWEYKGQWKGGKAHAKGAVRRLNGGEWAPGTWHAGKWETPQGLRYLLARRGDGGMPLGEADRAPPSARATRGTEPGSATPWGRLGVHSRGTAGGRSNGRGGRQGESTRASGRWQGTWRHGRYGRRGGCSDSKGRPTLGVTTGDMRGQGQGDGGPRAKEANVAAEPEVGGVGGRRGEGGEPEEGRDGGSGPAVAGSPS
jgi:hypothetical protein